jgi:hypothetical protein
VQRGVARHILLFKDLPEARYEAISDPMCVFHIPWQILLEELLLLKDSPNRRWYPYRDNSDSPPCVEREGYADDHDQDARVHGMPHERVWAS